MFCGLLGRVPRLLKTIHSLAKRPNPRSPNPESHVEEIYPSRGGDDMAALWGDALDEYCRITGDDFRDPNSKFHALYLRLEACSDEDELLGVLDSEMQALDTYRHGSGWPSRLRTSLLPIANCVLAVIEVGGEAAAATKAPGGKALLLAVAILLKAAVGVSEALQALMELLESFASYVACLKIDENEGRPIEPDLRKMIVQTLVEMLRTLAYAVQTMGRGRWVHYLRILAGQHNEALEHTRRADKLMERDMRFRVTSVHGMVKNLTAVSIPRVLFALESLRDEVSDQGQRITRFSNRQEVRTTFQMVLSGVRMRRMETALVSLSRQIQEASSPAYAPNAMTIRIVYPDLNFARLSRMAGGLLGLVRLLSGVEQASLRGSIATLSDGTTTNLSSGDTEDTTTVSLASSMSASSVLDAVHNAAVGVFEAFTRWTYIWPFQQGISRNPDFRIILIDAVGHEMVLQVGMSWNDVHTALLERFRGRAGWNYVQSNSYNLLVPGTSPDRISVIEPHAWGQTVQAGLIVEMSIVIRQQSTSAQCPYCNLSTSQDSMNRRVICSGCGESYVASETQAHVEEVEETNDLVQPSIETTHPDGLSGSSPLRLSTELEINHRDTGRSSPMQLSVETTHPDPRSPMPVLPIPSSFGPAPAPLQDEDPSVSIGLSAPVLNNHEATPPAATFDQHEPREPDDLKLFNSVTVLHSHKRSNFQASHLENRLFALLIGVDTYKYLNEAQHLKGAVRDAKRVGDFLCQQNPPVSKERIIFLKNEEATVDSIITQLKGLCKNTEIQRGDPILIYYAGHGSTLLKPEGWMNEDSRIQCLSAHDARTGPDGTVIGVVSDRTFGCLLQRLADAKGNKITVILDCCYSGSGTRDEETVPRGIEFKAADGLTDVTVNPSYQQNYWASVDSHRQVVVASQFANAGLRSHVVLAACGPNESAFEDRIKNEGRFTSAFLRVLEKAGTDTLTYAELIRRLDYLPSQTPRCEGRDKETRILFDSGLKQHDRDCYAIKNSGATHSPYIISAGQIHGIGKGDVFAVYRDRDAFTSEDEPLGRLVASVVSLDSSLASLADDSLSSVLGMAGAVAVLSRVHSPDAFRVNIAINDAVLRERVSEVLERMVKESADSAESSSLPNSSKPRVTQAAASKASIVIVSDGEDMVTFTYQSEHIYGTLGIERLSGPVRTNKDTLASALRSAAHFFRHLGPSPSSSHFLLRDHVDVRIWELEGGVGISDEGRFVNTYKPKGNFIDAKLCGMFRPTLSHVNGQNPTQTLYGVDVVNRSGLGLYLWLFYFDCSTLQILEYYSPVVTAGNGEPPLREGMTLPLNYGDSGGIPLAFEVPDGQEADGGFLRIFLTTRPIDMSKVAQNGVIGRPGEVTTEDVWDAVTIPVKLK